MAPRPLVIRLPAFWHLDAARGPSTPSFDHLVGDGDQPGRNDEVERFRRLHVDDEFKLCRALDRQIGGLLAVEEPTGIYPRPAIQVFDVCSVAPPDHSMTSSARASSEGSTSRPRALAV